MLKKIEKTIHTNDGNHSCFAFNAGNLHAEADGVAVADQFADDGLHLGCRHILAPPTEGIPSSIL